jgi:rhamnose utilization protein RhaD (predicted bifunctional aldolase and dehydrogenase)
MATIWQPELVTDDLVTLTRSLGEPDKDLVILAEGNTSKRLADGRIVVKASGAYMAVATRDDFVVTDVQPLIDLMDDAASSQEDLTALLDAGEHDGARRRGSIETLVHVAVQSVRSTAYVAHTHPTAVLGLLSSVHAESAFAEWVYSDEAVVIGVPLFVPYAAPGIALGRVFLQRLRDYVAERGELPSVVLMGNHGIVAIGGSVGAVEAITLMTVKGARTRVQALSIGGMKGLDADAVAKYFERTDMVERRKNLAGTA